MRRRPRPLEPNGELPPNQLANVSSSSTVSVLPPSLSPLPGRVVSNLSSSSQASTGVISPDDSVSQAPARKRKRRKVRDEGTGWDEDDRTDPDASVEENVLSKSSRISV
jgi:hypothetical protein